MIEASSSPSFQAAIEQAAKVAKSAEAVLLIGESGTGKEVLADYIHRRSPLSAGPFVKVNCAAIPNALLESELFGHEMRRGKFERAGKGTLFLDEIGDLPAEAQARLVRALQQGEFCRVGGRESIRIAARVISATCRDLSAMVEQGGFRKDLFYRVSVVPIRIPALRERPEDIAPMARYFLEDVCARHGLGMKSFQPAVWKAFEDYAWPGNVRQLQNVVERMAFLSRGDTMGVSEIPSELKPRPHNGSPYRIQ